MEANSLCLVDSELSSLLDAPLQPLLRHINAHCNVLRELAGLERVVNLVSLDVSANQLVSMRGLECLRQLKVLNISCNRLEALESLEHLASLQWLDASHNAIADISNVSALGRSARLETVILHGNRLHSCQNLIAHLSSIQHSLKHLSLWTDRTDRSVAASIPDESETALAPLTGAVWRALPSLAILNGALSTGESASFPQPSVYTEVEADVAGHLTSLNPISESLVPTPHIDQVLNELAKSLHSCHVDGTTTDLDSQTASSSHFRQLNIQSQPMASDESESDTPTSTSENHAPQPTTTAAVKAVTHRKTSSKSTGVKSNRPQTQTLPVQRRSSRQTGGKNQVEQHKIGKKPIVTRHAAPEPAHPPHSMQSTLVQPPSSDTSSASATVQSSEVPSEQQSYPQTNSRKLNTETALREEVERRVKAEHALQLLTSTVQRLQGEVNTLKSAGVRWKQQWVQASSQLQAVVKEAEAVRDQLKEEKVLNNELKQRQAQQFSDADRELKSLQDKLASTGTRHAAELKQEKDEVQRLTLLCARHQQDADTLRAAITAQSSQTQFLQAMVGDLVSKRNANLPEELSKLIMESAVGKRDGPSEAHAALVTQLHKEIDNKEKQYSALEDEFREALKMEAARFQQLQVAAEEQAVRCFQVSDALERTECQEKEATAMVARLTGVLRDQQNKVRDLTQKQLETKSPKEMHASYERQIASLEATVQALRDEQQRWQADQHQKESALRKERLDLEMQLSKATAQTANLRAQLQEANESLVVKSKMLDDQNTAIKELKEKLAKSKTQLTDESRSMAGRLQQAEENLASISIAHQDLQEEVDALRERKQQLKSELATASGHLQEFDSACSVLQEQISKKDAQLGEKKATIEELQKKIATLEEELQRLHEAIAEQTTKHKLDYERQEAASQQRIESSEVEHRNELLAVKQVHEKLLEEAEKKVTSVEQEMRMLLTEQEAKQRDVQTLLAHLHGLVASDMPPPLLPVPQQIPAGHGEHQRHHSASPLPTAHTVHEPHSQHSQLPPHPTQPQVDQRQQSHPPTGQLSGSQPGSTQHSCHAPYSVRGGSERRSDCCCSAHQAQHHTRRGDASSPTCNTATHRESALTEASSSQHTEDPTHANKQSTQKATRDQTESRQVTHSLGKARISSSSQLQQEVQQRLQKKQRLLQQLEQLNAAGYK